LFVDAEAEFLEKIDDYIKEHEDETGVRAIA
jgi:hypothetical protein